jgi:hypothetical protein
MDIHIPIPETPIRRPESSRDIRLQCQTLYDIAHFSVDEIALQVNLSVPQVYYALEHRTTPQKPRYGRKTIYKKAFRQAVIKWITSSSCHRKTPIWQIAEIWGIGEKGKLSLF